MRLQSVLYLLIVPASVSVANAQGTPEDYRRARRFLPPAGDTLMVGGSIVSGWIGQTDRLWYRRDRIGTREFLVADPVRRTSVPAFDHARLATGLTEAVGRRFRADSLDIESIDLTRRDTIVLTLGNQIARCAIDTYRCKTGPRDQAAQGRSPDGRWVAFVRDYNLFVRDSATGAERQLTTDGTRDYAYATPVINPAQMIAQGTSTPRAGVIASWSRDSKRLLTIRMDTRNAGRLTMTQYAPPGEVRPRSYEYVYPLAIDSVLPREDLIVFNVDGWKRVDLQGGPIDHYYYGATLPEWTQDGTRLTLTTRERGYAKQSFLVWDATTGARRVVLEEKGEPYFDVYGSGLSGPFNNASQLLWASQRSGWNHLYLYDVATAQSRQLTSGEWVVRSIARVDTGRRIAYVTGIGRESGRDPYLTHLYAISLDGGAPRLLTPEPAEHQVSFSPGSRYFIDTYSRIDQPPVTVLRSAENGNVIMELDRADISRLSALGWRAPETFEALAEDGKTKVFGAIWKPTNFDSTRRYPVIEQVYTGPHGFFVPKNFFGSRGQLQALAELGFVVIMLDAPGTAGRARAFHDVSYKNLGGGVSQHPHIIRQAAATRPYMDITRVGIMGHSAGGYDAAHAILAHPDFYKVAVSSAGDHDARLDKAVWNEQWMGWPVGDHYAQQANARLASNLKGKLLLMHGDVDDNVPMANTMQLVDALIRADKVFDLVIMPGQNHGSGGSPYFVRRRWDYFVEHLLGVKPPQR
jgi:dipeptidyl aminopeptidase/acylaminoacyl peptidase